MGTQDKLKQKTKTFRYKDPPKTGREHGCPRRVNENSLIKHPPWYSCCQDTVDNLYTQTKTTNINKNAQPNISFHGFKIAGIVECLDLLTKQMVT